MVEELAQRTGGAGAARLLAVDGIKTLVDKETQGCQKAGPCWRLSTSSTACVTTMHHSQLSPMTSTFNGFALRYTNELFNKLAVIVAMKFLGQ